MLFRSGDQKKLGRVPLVLTAAGQGLGFANAVTPTIASGRGCGGGWAHSRARRDHADDTSGGALTRGCAPSFSRPPRGCVSVGHSALRGGRGVGAARVIRAGRAARVHGQCVGAVAEVFSGAINRR